MGSVAALALAGAGAASRAGAGMGLCAGHRSVGGRRTYYPVDRAS